KSLYQNRRYAQLFLTAYLRKMALIFQQHTLRLAVFHLYRAALEAGKVGREPAAVAKGRRLSKAEVKLIYPEVKSIIQQEIL
ncbi:hypothetical protein, partial [Listeria monocytogenes]|uniref:hypothetical protein n=1 Tax=Listeria monocytogenes TaxID=1639 RepID=UPI001F0F29FB